MLEDIVGTFLKKEDIPENGTIRKLLFGMNPLYVIDTLYRANIYSLYDRSINPSMDIPWKNIDDALNNFSAFNILYDIEKAANAIGAIKHKPMLNMDEYINRISNKYFKFRRQQLDCTVIVDGFNGELAMLAAQMGISINYNPLHTLRIVKSPNIYIGDEAYGLQMNKYILKKLNNNMRDIIWELYNKVPIAERENCEVEL